jgi:hypothetical protein
MHDADDNDGDTVRVTTATLMTRRRVSEAYRAAWHRASSEPRRAAKRTTDSPPRTQAHRIRGTPDYLSPCVLRGARCTRPPSIGGRSVW